jgi:hypothetical protein
VPALSNGRQFNACRIADLGIACVESRVIGRQSISRSKPLSPNDRLVIALHSPDGVAETGLPLCPLEKKASKPA